MLDPHLLRRNMEAVSQALAKRGFELDIDRLQALEQRRKEIQVATEKLQSDRNRQSKRIGQAKAAGEDIEPLLAQVASLGDELKSRQTQLEAIQEELYEILHGVPNIPHSSVPAGTMETDNVENPLLGRNKRYGFYPKRPCGVGRGPGNARF